MTHTRLLGLLSSGVLAVGAMAAVPFVETANAVESSTATTPAASSAADRFTDGRYVVLLREPSATRYGGANQRYAATKATGGEQFQGSSAKVRAYTAHLRRTQDDIAGEVGTDPVASYTIASNGFAARLSAEQALDLATDRRVLLVQKDTLRHTDTWNTPTALALNGANGSWARHGGQARAGDGIVVGDIDSGAWPESKSFAGAPLTEAPTTKWDISRTGTATRMEKADGGVFTGQCQLGDQWTADNCSTKIIGARFYPDAYVESTPPADQPESEFLSPRDGSGHGSHTASTAAGNIVGNVKTEGIKFGEVSGMAPAAKLAIYKVCFENVDPDLSGCAGSAMLAAIDDAVTDGVDVINFSISGATDTVIDAVELAFEGAAEAGVFVAASAGNSGPTTSTVAHNSPWLTTVAAATHYNFENTLVLGNDRKFVGASITNKPVGPTKLVDSEASVVAGGDPADAALCGPDTLDPAKVSGTMVICVRGTYARADKSAEVKRAGGVAMVLVNPSENSLDADFHAVPTIHIANTGAAKLFRYLEAKGVAATAQIKLGNLTSTATPLPQVAGFSSRGPAIANDSDLLKPDIAAPGASVLAAVAPPSNSGRNYDLYSGTSMSAPHITGLAAFILGVHPSWSPQRIQSAMMTTAKRLKSDTGAASNDVFGAGSGIVNPKKFFDPGLFVMSTPRQWLGFITDQGLDTGIPALEAKDINLPSMAQGQVTSSTSFTRTFESSMKGTWKIAVNVPGFTSTPSSSTLVSKRSGDLEDITVDFTRTTAPLGEFAKGWIRLTGPTSIRIPVALRPVSVRAPASVEGDGVAGSLEVPITAGFTGALAVGVTGLAKATSETADVAAGADYFKCVTVSETSKLARFDVDAVDDTADLDLFVYQSDSCDIADAFALAGQSATGSADESVTIADPEPGTYIVNVNGFASGTAGSPIGFDVDFYDVNVDATLGGLAVTPNPVPVQNAVETSFDVSWTGLEVGNKYLGYLEYDGALAPTYVNITS